MAQHTARRLKVAPHFAARRYDTRITSKLLLQGAWLEAAGFAPGAVAAIEGQAGRLIITAAPVQ
ncbi:MAG: SymE family type I addiction module toxin [Janthinobacterium lividum]